MNNSKNSIINLEFDRIIDFLSDSTGDRIEDINEDIKKFDIDPDRISENVKSNVFTKINEIIKKELLNGENIVAKEKSLPLINNSEINIDYRAEIKKLINQKQFNLKAAAYNGKYLNIEKMDDQEIKNLYEQISYLAKNKND